MGVAFSKSLAIVLTAAVAARLSAQAPVRVWPMPIDPVSATTGSTDEQSLLLLQLVGRAPLFPIGIRSLTQRELDTLASIERPSRAEWLGLLPSRPRVGIIYNTSHAFGVNDGVVWAGRGVTGTITAGGVARVGPFSFAARPVAFWTQNQAFQPAFATDSTGFANPLFVGQIDIPYRFGNKSYARLDAGESWAQIDTRWIVAGISTATQAWGPMHVYPLLLGTNAGGFPHVLAGTGLPWNIGIGRVTGRMAVGRLDASAFSAAHDGDPRRLASELVATFSPAGLEGLELGAGRFFHRRWPTSGFGPEVLSIPFEGFLKDRLMFKDSSYSVKDNQLASAFFRIVRPQSGLEVYGEFLRDDHSYDTQDLLTEPDHESAYALGLRRAWDRTRTDGALTVLTVEMVNGRVSRLVRRRPQTVMYVHPLVPEGHTERGKLLASPAALGGTGFHFEIERRNLAGGWRAVASSESLGQMIYFGEGGTIDGRPAGDYNLTLARILNTYSGEYTISLTGQIAWNNQSGGNNLNLAFAYRP